MEKNTQKRKRENIFFFILFYVRKKIDLSKTRGERLRRETSTLWKSMCNYMWNISEPSFEAEMRRNWETSGASCSLGDSLSLSRRSQTTGAKKKTVWKQFEVDSEDCCNTLILWLLCSMIISPPLTVVEKNLNNNMLRALHIKNFVQN